MHGYDKMLFETQLDTGEVARLEPAGVIGRDRAHPEWQCDP